MRNSTKARYIVVLDKPVLHFVCFDHGELDAAQNCADEGNGCLIKAVGEGVDIEYVHTLMCDPEDHKLIGTPPKKLTQ